MAWLVAGAFVLMPHGSALVMGSAPDAPAVDLDGFFATADGETAVLAGGGECSGLGGYFELGGIAAAPLLRAMPLQGAPSMPACPGWSSGLWANWVCHALAGG